MKLTELAGIKIDTNAKDYDPEVLAKQITRAIAYDLPYDIHSNEAVLSEREVEAMIGLILLQAEISEI